MARYLFFLFIVIGCTPKQSDNSQKADTAFSGKESIVSESPLPKKVNYGSSDSGIYDLVKDIEDTLLHFKFKPSFFVKQSFGSFIIKGFITDREKFAVAQILGIRILVYKYINEKWKNIFYEELDMCDWSPIEIKLTDINFDGHKDVLVAHDQCGLGSTNILSTVFLYDKEAKTLKRTPYLDLNNLVVDYKGKLLRTHSYRGPCWVKDKKIYKFSGDSIELIAEAVYDPVCYKDTLEATSIYLYANGRIKDSTFIRASNSWDIYLKALWDISKDYD